MEDKVFRSAVQNTDNDLLGELGIKEAAAGRILLGGERSYIAD